MSMLMALSFEFLALVVINNGFKYVINTYKGRLGERLLRRIRFQLIDRVLRFPPSYFKRTKSSEVATMIKDEVEPIGGFITILLTSLIVPLMPYLLSFAAGAMMYVVVEELIPEMSQGEHSDVGVITFAVGFMVMMSLDVALG